ncbi:MAG: hypothetical protein EBT90_11750 [Rhodobacteraceae bacterium]|nr:hypothetical protein [Paracoccaceae bacterium]
MLLQSILLPQRDDPIKKIYSEEELNHFIGLRLYFSTVLQADKAVQMAINITIFFIFFSP